MTYSCPKGWRWGAEVRDAHPAGEHSGRARRDVSSVTGLQAAEYEVQVDAGRYDEAVRLLSRPTAA